MGMRNEGGQAACLRAGSSLGFLLVAQFADRTTQHVALNTKVKNSHCWQGSRKKKKYRDSSDPKAVATNKHSWPGHGPLSRT